VGGWGGRQIERHRIKQNHRMGFRVRQIKHSAERVAQLVMQCHANTARHGFAQRGTILGGFACRDIVRLTDDARQRMCEGALQTTR
jgi:hypothetical protein